MYNRFLEKLRKQRSDMDTSLSELDSKERTELVDTVERLLELFIKDTGLALSWAQLEQD